MNITVDQVIVWLIVGALAGSFVGTLVRRRREGFGRFTNLAVGLVGALLGGLLFKLLHLNLGLGQIAVTLEDLLAAIVGSLILLLAVWWLRRARQPQRA